MILRKIKPGHGIAVTRSKGKVKQEIIKKDYFFKAEARFLPYQMTATTYATQAIAPIA